MSEMEWAVRFEVLGPIRVHADSGEVTVTGRRRSLLAMLLVHADKLVDIERLIDAIWGDTPPRDARNQVQVCVSRLRRQLITSGSRDNLIITNPAGYRLEVAKCSIDLLDFRRHVAQARAAITQGRSRDALDGYRAAIELWRGPALAGVDSDRLREIAVALDEERLSAIEQRIKLDLALGGAGELVPELTGLVAQHPYREGLYGALMVALHRAGRSADALAAYQRAHTILVDEVGTEPGLDLRELHKRILSEDPSLAPPVGVSGADDSARHSLPRAVNDFTGRPEAVAKLIDAAQPGVAGPVVLAIDGMAGIGKTTLAVYVAHRVADRYPDAQLFIDLHGHSDRRPVEPLTALDTLLRQLGIPGGRIPSELEDRAALWRSELAHRSALVVLDNVSSTSQVAPLIPAAPACLVLVTSRRRLRGLDASRPLSLELFTAQEAVALLARIAGTRVRAEPEWASEVVSRCGYLPLAIRLAGARLAHRPSWNVRDLAGRLRAARGLLTELAAESRNVADALACSYAQLRPDLQRVFRLLGLHPGDDFDACAVAALADIGQLESQRALDELVDNHLVDEHHSGRFRLHDLVKEYAQQLTSTIDADSDRSAATKGLLSFYLHAAATTTQPLERSSSRRGFQLGEAQRKDLLEMPAARGMVWLEDERRNIAATVRYAVESSLCQPAWQLARAAWRFYYHRGYLDDLLETHRHGLNAAEKLADKRAIATMCNYLASAYRKLGRFNEAATQVGRALWLWSELGDRSWVANTKKNLGTVYCLLGRFEEAVSLCEDAFATYERLGDLDGMGTCLYNLSDVLTYLGRYGEAARCARRSLAIARYVGDLSGCANLLGNLAVIRIRLGDYAGAARQLDVSRSVQHRVGSREHEAEVINSLGMIERALRRYENAVRLHREAIVAAEDVGDACYALVARNEIGTTLQEMGEPAAALQQHRIVSAEAARMGLKYENARSLDGIAACLVASEPDTARSHWIHALRLYREMGVPEQAEAEHRLRERGWLSEELAVYGPPPESLGRPTGSSPRSGEPVGTRRSDDG